MVSAVHPARVHFPPRSKELQRGCTWLVQFIFDIPDLQDVLRGNASKGLHMVSAVHRM